MNFRALKLLLLIANIIRSHGIDPLNKSKLEKNEGVSYLTYTRANQTHWRDIRDANFNDSNVTVFIIHGFQSNLLDKPLQVKHDLFHYRVDVGRVIIVSWLDYSQGYGTRAATKVAQDHVPLLAEDLYEKIVHIRKNGAKIIKLIGHGMGAHVSGQTAKLLKSLGNEPVDQIYGENVKKFLLVNGLIYCLLASIKVFETHHKMLLAEIETQDSGLDPVGRYFAKRPDRALQKDDAREVVVFHTNMNFYGFKSLIGSHDKKVNGGNKQPNCKFNIDFCSHNEAWNSYSQYLRGQPINQEEVQIHSYVICLDVSRSMNDSMNGSNRLTRAVHSTREAISNLKSGTFIGIVKFNTEAKIVHKIIEIKGEADKISLQESLPTESSGSTSIGAGLRLSMSMLKEIRSTRNEQKVHAKIVLISDGEQWTEEWSGRDWTKDVLKDLQNADITVNSIAMGISASNDLETLSNATKGDVSYAMEDGTGQVLVDVMRAFSYMFESRMDTNDTVHLTSKEVTLESREDVVSFIIDKNNGKDTEFKFVSYNVEGVDVKLRSPYGRNFSSSSSEYFYDPNTVKGFRFGLAEPGQWNFTLTKISKMKRSVQSTFFGTVVANTHQRNEEPTIRLSADVSGRVLEYPKPLTITAELRSGKFPVIHAEVFANIRAPNQKIIRLQLYDNGVYPDELANDGLYTNDIMKLPKPERYSVIVKALSNGTAMLVPKKIDYFLKDVGDCRIISCQKLNDFEREADVGSIKFSSQKNEDKIPPRKVGDLRGMIKNEVEKLIALEWTSPNDESCNFNIKRYDIRALINGTNFENGLTFNASNVVEGSIEAGNCTTTKVENIVIKVPDHIWNCVVENVTQPRLKFALKYIGLNNEISERSNIAYVIIKENASNTTTNLIKEDEVKSSSARLRHGCHNLFKTTNFSCISFFLLVHILVALIDLIGSPPAL